MSISKYPFVLSVSLTAALTGLAALPASAQTCEEPTSAQFRVDTLANNASADLYGGSENGNYGVVQIAVADDGRVFIAKMCSGHVQVYTPGGSPSTPTTRAGTVPTKCNNEDGLLGIVLAPDFAVTKWLYVFHTDAASVDFSSTAARNTDARAHVLTRYTYDANAAAGSQLTQPKVILRFNRIVDRQPYHAAGGLDMSADGTLIIGTGDDTSPHSSALNSTNNCPQDSFGPTFYPDRGCDAQKSSSNSNDLRGKILRIKPIAFPDSSTPAPGIGATYAIPAGNLWELIDNPSFNPNWKSAEDNILNVRKEIYTMGHRNPYHPRIDSKSGWIFTGEVGPDAGAASGSRGPEGREEFNLATKPGFYGHPYCIGPNTPWNALTNASGAGTAGDPWVATYGAVYSCSAPQNASPNNTGIRNLPPAVPATLWYSAGSTVDDGVRMGNIPSNSGTETAIGGPMYRYDTALVSSVKFPPQYEGKIFFFDWYSTNKASFRLISLNPDGTIDAGAAATRAFPGAQLPALPNGSYIDMRFGKDGAMYLLQNSAGGYNNFAKASLYRIAYTGPIDNACYQPFVATVGPITALRGKPARAMLAPALIHGTLLLPAGYRGAELYDLSGRKVWAYSRPLAARGEAVKIPAHLRNGILQAKLLPQ